MKEVIEGFDDIHGEVIDVVVKTNENENCSYVSWLSEFETIKTMCITPAIKPVKKYKDFSGKMVLLGDLPSSTQVIIGIIDSDGVVCPMALCRTKVICAELCLDGVYTVKNNN